MKSKINFLKNNKTIISISIAFIIGIFLFFQNSIKIEKWIQLLIVVLFPLIPQLIDLIIEKYSVKIRKESIKENLNYLDNFYVDFLNDKRIQNHFQTYLEHMYNTLEEINLITIGEEALRKNYKDNKILIIYYCFLINYNFAQNQLKNKARIEISSIFENNNIKSLEDLKNSELNGLLEFYESFKNKKILSLNIKIDENKLFNDFTEKYLSTINAYHVLNLKGKKIQEFQRTLSRLIDEGKIHTKNIIDDIKKFKEYNAYLMFSNLLEENPDVKAKIDKYHHIDFKGSLGEYKYKSKIMFIKEKINPEHFLKENFYEIYKEHEKIPGFVGLYPIEIRDLHLFPNKVDEIIETENFLKRNYKKLQEYQLLALTGNSEIVLNSSTIEITEILSNIPVNIFIPNEKKIVKDFIVNNYENLKKTFNIKKIYDWAEVNDEDLKNYFIEKDKDKISDNWEEISKIIIEEVKKIKESIKNNQS